MRNAYALLAVAVLSLTGCGWLGPAQVPDVDYSIAPFRGFATDADLAKTTGFAVQNLLASARPIDPGRALLVSTLSDVNDLQSSSSFGRMVSEQIATALVQAGYMVPEIKLRQNLVVRSGSGEFMLSRNLAEITRSSNAQAVVTGTYSAGPRAIAVSLHIVRLTDGIIIGGYDYTVPNGSNTRSLIETAVR